MIPASGNVASSKLSMITADLTNTHHMTMRPIQNLFDKRHHLDIILMPHAWHGHTGRHTHSAKAAKAAGQSITNSPGLLPGPAAKPGSTHACMSNYTTVCARV